MSSIGTGYDLSASQFSPDGRVFQVEYAQKAVENSGTAIALRAKDGVVFAVEKLVLSKLYESTANRRIFLIDRHIGMDNIFEPYCNVLHGIRGRLRDAVAGLLADARQIVETARTEAANYRSEYGSPIPLKYLTDRVSMYMHAYTLYSAVRPFGCSVLMASHDKDDGPQLYTVDPSGVSWGYLGSAIGKAKQAAKTEIEKLKLKDMTCRQLIKEAAKIIYVVHDEVKDKNFELQLSWVCEESKYRHEYVPREIHVEAEKYATDALAEESESEEEDL